MFIQGLNLGIDVAGGNLFQISFTEQTDISEEVRSAINDLDIGTNRIPGIGRRIISDQNFVYGSVRTGAIRR